MNIDHMSISREGVWHECQAKYKFKYHLKVYTDQETPFHFVFGKLVHRIIEEHMKSKGLKSVQAIKSEILSGQIQFEENSVAPKLDNESHIRLSRHLGNYIRMSEKIGFEGEIEWPFSLDLDPPNNRCIKGIIDRLIIKNDKAVILDWKTTKPSRWRKDITTITKDLQLACYCWVVNKHFGIEAKNISAALYYLDDGKLVPVKFCQQTLDNVPVRLTKVYKDIEQCEADKAHGRVGDWCRFCDYRKICPFYALT